jgi:hypothetical protein
MMTKTVLWCLSVGLVASLYAQALESAPAGKAAQDSAIAQTPQSPQDSSAGTVNGAVAPEKDTVLVLSGRDKRDRDEARAEGQEHQDNDRAENKSAHVGAGGLSVELFSLDTRPIEKIARSEKDLVDKRFDFSSRQFLTVGVMGYGGPRHGLRTGIGLWGGYRQFYSDEYPGVTHDPAVIRANGGDTIVDSVARLQTVLAYAGFIADMPFTSFEHLNVYAGAMLGGGVMVVIKDFLPVEKVMAFSNTSVDTSDTSDWAVRVAVAPMWACDVHAGLTYAVTPWLHLAIEGKVLFLYSSSGFGYGYGSFRSYNPGGRIRLVFGNAG